MILRFLPLLALLILISACAQSPDSSPIGSIDLMDGVQLGKSEDMSIASRFRRYQRKGEGCHASSNGNPRVIVTGFGLFSGIPFNISGLVVSNMAAPQFWPDNAQIDSAVAPALNPTPESGDLVNRDWGARAENRVLNLDGKSYDVCFLTLDVLWDLAPAVIVYEMNRFQPQFVLMTGEGADGVIFEGGAFNVAADDSGFFASGKDDPRNTPRGPDILPRRDRKVQSEIQATWDNVKIKAATDQLITDLGFQSQAPSAARAGNNYICNNVLYVALEAAAEAEIVLAGSDIVLKPKFSAPPQVGFMHFPQTTDNAPAFIFGWNKVLAKVIETALPQ